MTKRFTAVEKWDDPWFFELDERYKLAWLFLLDKCNHAGIWNVNNHLLEMYLGFRPQIEAFKGRIFVLSAEKWFIPKFVEFQYGTLSPSNRAHLSVINLLRKEGAYKVLTSSLQGAKDKDKDKDKKGGVGENKAFENFYAAYPRHEARAEALKAFSKIKPDEALLQKIISVVEIKKKSEQWLKENGKYVPLPATWLNQRRWEDEVTPREKVIL